MNGTVKAVLATAIVAFLGGSALGWTLARQGRDGDAPSTPEHWVARIGNEYISAAAFIDEMRRRGGERPGQFQDMEQKRSLLDDLVYRAALVKAAEQAGMTTQPDLRRTLDQVISNRYLQENLRRVDQVPQISDAEVEQYYQAHSEDYVVPARKRVAMLKIAVAANAGEPEWSAAMTRMHEARKKALALDHGIAHFGALAREYSDDEASRWRGGVLGWIADGRSDRYSYDRAVIEATRALEQPGSVSEPLRGKDGVYLVRLVESEARQTRGLDQLASGIRQHLQQQRIEAAAKQFRERLMHDVGVEVRESELAAIQPLSAPGREERPQPPAMPSDQG